MNIKRLLCFAAAAGCLLLCASGFLKQKTTKIHSFSEEKPAVKIIYQQGHVLVSSGTGVKKEKNTVTITKGGEYIVKGESSNGRILVDVGDEEKVKLKFNGLVLKCADSCPLYVKNADKVVIRMKQGTENILTDADFYTMDPDSDKNPAACIYSRSDLTIKGAGSLTVNGNYHHGISCTKDLKIKDGIIRVKAQKDAVRGKKSVLIEGGSLFLSAGRDGIHSRGNLTIKNKKIEIDARKYGMYAFGIMDISGSSHIEIRKALVQKASMGKTKE